MTLFERLHAGDETAALAAARELGEQARAAGRRVVVVSACLCGERVRFDGEGKAMPEAVARATGGAAWILPLCPELLGGMGCPRPPVHFAQGDGDALADGRARVVDDRGRDHTAALARGAELADRLAAAAGAASALLKERSPSCGAHAVHGPAGIVPGRGAFAARLARRHLPVLSEEDVIQTR